MVKLNPDSFPFVRFHRYFNYVVHSVNLLTLSYGISCGWPSPNIFLLRSEASPLASGKITIEEASWIASLLCVGGVFGNFFFTYVTSKFGRKKPLLAIASPAIVSLLILSVEYTNIFVIHNITFVVIFQMGWALILFAPNVSYLYLARLLNGVVAGGIFAIIPQYLAEVSSDQLVKISLDSIYNRLNI